MKQAWPKSAYAEDAPLPPPAPPLQGTARVQVAVVGAGVTGLSAALHLAEAGRDVAVLDRMGPGWGASGRNGGQVNPGLKPDPDQVAAMLGGGSAAEVRIAEAWNAPNLVFDLIERHGIACDAVRGGTLRVAARRADVPGLQALAAQCARRNMPVELLDGASLAARTGTTAYRAGLLDRRGGQINPLAYSRGLATAGAGAGARLHGQSAVVRLARAGQGWLLQGAGFTLHADQVVLAGNGYTDRLWPGLAQSIIPVFSAVIASHPLPAVTLAPILPGREVVYDLGTVTTYYRVDAMGRLLIGGRSRSRHLSGPGAFPFLAGHAARLWPALAGVSWGHGWNGQLALTPDHYPHWHEPAPGLFACLGYNGRGVAMGTLMGRKLAHRLDGLDAGALLLPPTPIRPIPLHRFWKLGVGAGIAWSRLRDATGRG